MKGDKPTRLMKLQKVKAGLSKHFQPASTLTVGGTTYPVQDLMNLIQGNLDAIKAADDKKAEWRALVSAARTSHVKVAEVLRLLRGMLVHMFGDSQAEMSVLEDFGYTPRKRTKPTAKTQVEADAKTKATRAARHTMGSKQKEAIKGEIPATPSTPKV